MSESNKMGLIVAFVIVVLLFVVFGFGTISGSFGGGGMMGGGRMMGDGTMGQSGFGDYGWMWIPMVITLGIGIFLGWLLFAKRK